MRTVLTVMALWLLACSGVAQKQPADSPPPSPEPSPATDALPADTKTIEVSFARPDGDEPGCMDCEPVTPDHIQASSASAARAGDFSADLAFDSELTTAWCAPEGAWVEARFKAPVALDNISLNLGNLANDEVFQAFGKPRELLIEAGSQRRLVKLPKMPVDYLDLSKGYAYPNISLDGSTVSSVRVTIRSAYPGSKESETCISGLLMEHLSEP